MDKRKNRRSKPKVKYQGFALDVLLIDKINKHIAGNPNYRSTTDFVRKAIDLKLNVDTGNISLPGFQNDPVMKSWNDFLEKCKKLADKEFKKKNKIKVK